MFFHFCEPNNFGALKMLTRQALNVECLIRGQFCIDSDRSRDLFLCKFEKTTKTRNFFQQKLSFKTDLDYILMYSQFFL